MPRRGLWLWPLGACCLVTQVLAEDLLGADSLDLLAEEPLTLAAPAEAHEAHWSDGLKLTFEQSQGQNQDATYLKRSRLRLEYEQGWGDGWFVRLDGRYTHYWADDLQATLRGEAYDHSEVQELWAQYSAGACAYKVGKQRLVWGVVDGTFVVDVITPLDYTEPLLTDYANLRLGQEMLLADCFAGAWQGQLFYLPEARLDRVSHSGYGLPLDTGAEYGARLKVSDSLGELSLYAAHLYANTPTPVTTAPGLAVAEYDLLGLSTTLVHESLIGQIDLALKPDQWYPLSNQRRDRLDVAIGLEYVTASNHNLNAGVMWNQWDNPPPSSDDSSPLYTLGWRQSYLHDTLAMSLLAYRADQPRFWAVNLLADYQWDDHWSVAGALGVADFATGVTTPFGTNERSVSVTVTATY